MGQAKQRKNRLGEWYGKPVGPGHPDFVPPKKPEPIRPHLRFDMDETVIETKIEDGTVYADRVEVIFVDGNRDVFWPKFQGKPIRGKLKVGSVDFGMVELCRYTEIGCVFLRVQSAREETTRSGPIEEPTEDVGGQEGYALPVQPPSHKPATNRPRRMSMFATMAMLGAVLSSKINLGPDPEYKKRGR